MYTKKTFITIFSYQKKMFLTRTSFFPKGKRSSRKENLVRKSKPKKKEVVMRFLAKEDCLPWGRKIPIRKGEFIEEKIRYEGRQTLFGTG